MTWINASIYTMFNIQKICWGMLGVIAIGAIEPTAWAATAEVESIVAQDNRLAGEPSLASVLSGNTVPTSIELKKLTPEWRAMSTNGQFEFGNFQAFVSVFGGGSLATTYYTKGQTVSIGSETYIVAYSLLSLVEKVTPETLLNLSLLNLKTIGTMSNIRSFEAIAETKVLERQLATLQVANIFDPTKMDSPKDTPASGSQPEKPAVRPQEVRPKPTVRKRRIRSNRNYRSRYRNRNPQSSMNRK